jgi:hypothetical protein
VPSCWLAEEVIRGDHHNKSNVFAWDRLQLNLPGSDGYDPRLAWVSKVCSDGQLVADFFTYVDDIWSTGGSHLESSKAARQVGLVASYLGIQDAAQKQHDRARNQEHGLGP